MHLGHDENWITDPLDKFHGVDTRENPDVVTLLKRSLPDHRSGQVLDDAAELEG